jgi:hypothetical protein
MDHSTKIMGLLLGACGVGIMSPAADLPEELNEYDWRCTIGSSFESGKTYKAPLTADVFDGFRSFPLDMKVVDQNGETWPSVVWFRADHRGVDVIRAHSLDQPDDADETLYTALHFQLVPDRNGEIPPHNQVIVNAGSGECTRRVEVWGGTGVNNLKLLGTGLLIERKSPVPMRIRSISYPESRAPLISVRVFEDEQRPDESVTLRSAEIVHVNRDDDDHERVKMKRIDNPDGDSAPAGVYSVFVDSGSQNRPLLYLDVEVPTKDAVLPVRVYGRTQSTNKWRWVTDGGVYVAQDSRLTRIALAKSDYRQFRLDFYHGSNKPPRIDDIVAGALPHYLVFEARSAGKAFLYFGSSRYQLPMSDLSRRINVDSISDASGTTLSKRQTNPTRVANSLTAYGRTLLGLGLGVVGLLAAIVTLRILKQRYF